MNNAIPPGLVVEQDNKGDWAWVCPGCWLGSGLPTEDAAWQEAGRHVLDQHSS